MSELQKKNILKKALIFINGNPPKNLPSFEKYDIIACSDGAFHYLKAMNFPLEKLDFISGDFDSHSGSDEMVYQEKFIHTPDQEKTDFEKSLEIFIEKGASEVDVYGGSGGEQDHFLGNLMVAFQFKDKLKIKFFDEYSVYYFIPKSFTISDVMGRMISLYPFPSAKNIITNGLNWELQNEDLDITGRKGIRNMAVNNIIEITFLEGEILLFVSLISFS